MYPEFLKTGNYPRLYCKLLFFVFFCCAVSHFFIHFLITIMLLTGGWNVVRNSAAICQNSDKTGDCVVHIIIFFWQHVFNLSSLYASAVNIILFFSYATAYLWDCDVIYSINILFIKLVTNSFNRNVEADLIYRVLFHVLDIHAPIEDWVASHHFLCTFPLSATHLFIFFTITIPTHLFH